MSRAEASSHSMQSELYIPVGLNS